MAKFQYKKVDTHTLKGLKQAESLVSQGWRIISIGLHTLLLERVKPQRTSKK